METKKGTTFLIDGGSIDVSSVGTYRIQPFLLSKGVDKIDYAIVTHEDKDHISGLIEICKEGKVKIRNLVLPKIDKSRNAIDIIGEALAIEKNINIMYIKAGDYIREGRLNITCLHPREGYNYSTTNDYSTVLSVTYGEFDMLLTGDVELDGERAIINSLLNDKYVDENLVNSGYEVLKVAHHGSKNSTSEEFISIIKPDLSLISCGKNNRYGHPHEELLDRLDEAGSQVIITYESGAITIRTDGDRGTGVLTHDRGM
jgi:competence protein ComEC